MIGAALVILAALNAPSPAEVIVLAIIVVVLLLLIEFLGRAVRPVDTAAETPRGAVVTREWGRTRPSAPSPSPRYG